MPLHQDSQAAGVPLVPLDGWRPDHRLTTVCLQSVLVASVGRLPDQVARR